jgi:hypothetical protein
VQILLDGDPLLELEDEAKHRIELVQRRIDTRLRTLAHRVATLDDDAMLNMLVGCM